ncbi:MAG TPA: hypothetical protein VHK69_01815, partial [Chitinophagaceae bacterium]|nr:hypothetical protein [Chitinophagaceae bacterium]
TRLNPVGAIRYTLPPSVVKEYLLAGHRAFDRLLVHAGGARLTVSVERFTPDGRPVAAAQAISDFPAKLGADDFLLARSPDGSKILLLGFEPVEDAPPHVHARLYDGDWNLLFQKVYTDGRVAQPFLQWEESGYAAEYYDNSPLKLTNNGDWLMLAPARRNPHYLLWHFRLADSSVVHHTIRQPQGPAVQYTGLSIDEAGEEAILGLMVNTGSAPVKQVRIARYLVAERRLEGDTTYRFTTPYTDRYREKYLFQQDFIAVPSKGFLYLKEYGRTYVPDAADEEGAAEEDSTPGYHSGARTAGRSRPGSYSRNGTEGPARRPFERGDLSLHYFPVAGQDSGWSGRISREQTAELRAALSYACLPLGDRILFLYNNPAYPFRNHSTTTVLDGKGFSSEDEGLVFWKGGNTLDFQRARQINGGELAVPFQRNRLQGFAIIRP